MADRVLALYFEDNYIRLLVARGKQVERWASVSLDADLISGGLILDEKLVADKVKEIFDVIKHIDKLPSGGKKFRMGKRKIIVGMGGRDSLYRVLSLPVLSDALLEEAVYREAARILPVPLEELYLAYQRIPGNEEETRVFMAAFPKKTTDTLMRTLRMAGVTPHVLDLAPLALCSSVNEPRSIIADSRLDNLNIIVMADRVPQVIRSLALQSEIKTLTENMPTISEEFSRTVAFYNSSHQQEPLDADVPVFVSGDLADSPGTWPALVGRLNSKVSVLPSALEYPEDFPVSDFLVNLGLAAKSLSLEKEPANYSLINLNALPAAYRPQRINPYRAILPVIIVAGVVAVVFLFLTLQNNKSKTKDMEARRDNIASQIISNQQNISAVLEKNRGLQAVIAPLQAATGAFTDKISSLADSRDNTDTDLHTFIALKPGTVTVTKVMYSEKLITINGIASTDEAALGYAKVLRDFGGYEPMIVSSIDYVDGRYGFVLKLK
jgi:type IV pilus assembly protein PilM